MNVNVNNRVELNTADELLSWFKESGRDPRALKPASGDDARILRDVANALYWDMAVPHQHVAVSVEAGVVTLRGVVDYRYSRGLAEADARSVKGVVRVENAIVLRTLKQI